MKKIYIGSDHAGFNPKEKLKAYLSGLGYEVEDKGAFSYEENDDYPDFILPVAEAVVNDKGSFGIVIGGSGQGEAMAANKVKGARCALFYGPLAPKEAVDVKGIESNDPYEIIKLAREHNDANMISLGARFLNKEEVHQAMKIFLETPFSDDERHARRISKF
jgi:ribose 5-phosphate isomerase B